MKMESQDDKCSTSEKFVSDKEIKVEVPKTQDGLDKTTTSSIEESKSEVLMSKEEKVIDDSDVLVRKRSLSIDLDCQAENLPEEKNGLLNKRLKADDLNFDDNKNNLKSNELKDDINLNNKNNSICIDKESYIGIKKEHNSDNENISSKQLNLDLSDTKKELSSNDDTSSPKKELEKVSVFDSDSEKSATISSGYIDEQIQDILTSVEKDLDVDKELQSKDTSVEIIEAEKPSTSAQIKIDTLLEKMSLNSLYEDEEFMNILSETFQTKSNSHTFDSGAKILNEPFTCCELPNFIHPDEFVTQLKSEIDELEVEVRLNDLYQFKQSRDLESSKVPEIAALKQFLYGKCKDWMQKITGIDLTDTVDMSCSCYTYTDHLLCHDDELEGRRIAYIYYLVPEWSEEYGGKLELFNSDNNEPTDVCTYLVPEWNKLVFFEVSPVSYHQVAEVLAFKTRTAISGWFYGPPLPPVIRSEDPVAFMLPLKTPAIDLKKWINPTYLLTDTQNDIRESFEESSEMELMDFLEPSKFNEVCKALKKTNLAWKLKGPASKRKIEELHSSKPLPPALSECQQLFMSEAFLDLLGQLTGLKLLPSDDDDCPTGRVNCSVRRWKRGHYTLLHEHAFVRYSTLNAALCFNCPDWDVENGGYTSYVAKDEKDELLRVDPKPNSLALVYITEGTSSFVKYINSRVPATSVFHDIYAMYKDSE